MFRRFLFHAVGALALLAMLGVPGQIHAQRFRAGPVRPPQAGFGARSVPGFRHGFAPRFNRSFSGRPFGRPFAVNRLERRFERRLLGRSFDTRYGSGLYGAWTGAYASPWSYGYYPSGSYGYSGSYRYPGSDSPYASGYDPYSLYAATDPYSLFGVGAGPSAPDLNPYGEPSADSTPSPEDRRLGRLLTASGVPNDNGRLRWPLGLRVLGGPDSGHEADDLREQLEALFQVGAEQAADGKVDAEVRRQITRAADRLHRLLIQDREERFALSAAIYGEAERFLDNLKRRGVAPPRTADKTSQAPPAGRRGQRFGEPG